MNRNKHDCEMNKINKNKDNIGHIKQNGHIVFSISLLKY